MRRGCRSHELRIRASFQFHCEHFYSSFVMHLISFVADRCTRHSNTSRNLRMWTHPMPATPCESSAQMAPPPAAASTCGSRRWAGPACRDQMTQQSAHSICPSATIQSQRLTMLCRWCTEPSPQTTDHRTSTCSGPHLPAPLPQDTTRRVTFMAELKPQFHEVTDSFQLESYYQIHPYRQLDSHWVPPGYAGGGDTLPAGARSGAVAAVSAHAVLALWSCCLYCCALFIGVPCAKTQNQRAGCRHDGHPS